jgi:hypothetical protein
MFVLFVDMKSNQGRSKPWKRPTPRSFGLPFPARKAFAVWSCCARTRTVANIGSASLSSHMLCRKSGWQPILHQEVWPQMENHCADYSVNGLHLGLRSTKEPYGTQRS